MRHTTGGEDWTSESHTRRGGGGKYANQQYRQRKLRSSPLSWVFMPKITTMHFAGHVFNALDSRKVAVWRARSCLLRSHPWPSGLPHDHTYRRTSDILPLNRQVVRPAYGLWGEVNCELRRLEIARPSGARPPA